MKRMVSFVLLLVICLSLCACGKRGTELTTSIYDEYFDLNIQCADFNEQKGDSYRTCDGTILIGLEAKAGVEIDVDSVSVKITLDSPWSFGGATTKTVILERDGSGDVWFAQLDCNAKSMLVNTSISFSRSDISVKVTDISGYAN